MFVFYIMVYKWGMGGGGAIMGGSGVSTTTLRGASLGGITLLIDCFLHQGGLLSFLVLSTFLGDIFWGLFCLVIIENEKWRRTRSEWRTL